MGFVKQSENDGEVWDRTGVLGQIRSVGLALRLGRENLLEVHYTRSLQIGTCCDSTPTLLLGRFHLF